jgi:hypothetical protein
MCVEEKESGLNKNKMRPLAPKGGNDRVYTPIDLADKIVRHFVPPCVSVLEPCEGNGAFTEALLSVNGLTIDWCEIDKGRNFFSYKGKVDFVVTNPPWSQLRPFLNKSMEVSDNIVFLCLVNAFFMKARMRDMQKNGFGFVEILFVDTPSKPWPQTGFQLGAVYIKRGYTGSVKFSNITSK